MEFFYKDFVFKQNELSHFTITIKKPTERINLKSMCSLHKSCLLPAFKNYSFTVVIEN